MYMAARDRTASNPSETWGTCLNGLVVRHRSHNFFIARDRIRIGMTTYRLSRSLTYGTVSRASGVFEMELHFALLDRAKKYVLGVGPIPPGRHTYRNRFLALSRFGDQ